MHKFWKIINALLYFSFLLLTINVPPETGKCIPRGTCTPGWETLCYRLGKIIKKILRFLFCELSRKFIETWDDNVTKMKLK